MYVYKKNTAGTSCWTRLTACWRQRAGTGWVMSSGPLQTIRPVKTTSHYSGHPSSACCSQPHCPATLSSYSTLTFTTRSCSLWLLLVQVRPLTLHLCISFCFNTGAVCFLPPSSISLFLVSAVEDRVLHTLSPFSFVQHLITSVKQACVSTKHETRHPL